MSIQTSLFIDAPEVEDLSMTSLSTDSSEWPEEVITKLKERIPLVANASLSVKFMKTDDELGAATGSVTATNGMTSVVIPAIIKEFQLYPLDVFMTAGKILPLTNDYFAAAFQGQDQNQAFSALAEFPTLSQIDHYIRGETLQNVIFPPNWGRYAFASAAKAEGYPLLDSIQKDIDGSVFQKKAKEDPSIVARMYTSGHIEQFKKLANLKPVNMGEFRQGVDSLVQRTSHVLKKDGPNKYTILSTPKTNFNPAMSTCDRRGLKDFISKACEDVDSVLHEVDQNGEKGVVVADDTMDSPFLAKPQRDEIEQIHFFGRYNVRNKNGVNVEGIIVPTVIDFDQNKIDTKIFLGKTFSTMQRDIAGTPMAGTWMPHGCAPMVGQTGTFILREGDKGAVATIPVTIASVYRKELDGAHTMNIKAIDLQGAEMHLIINKDVELERIARDPSAEKRTYRIPAKMEWVVMDGFDEVSGSVFEYAIKSAAEKLHGNPIVVMSTGYGQYGMKGIEKYAKRIGWDSTCLGEPEAKFMLLAMGIGAEKIASTLQRANAWGKAELHGVNYPPLDSEKVAAAIPAAREMVKKAHSLRADFVKVASYMENAQTVDSLLSLNFVNPDNIAKFIAKIPQFKSTISHLASCLLASRIGIRELPEQSIASAITKMIDVVSGLEALRATQTMVEKK